MNTPVSFEVAKLLKENGFDEKCSHYYVLNFHNFKADSILHKCGLPNDGDNSNIFQFVKRTNQHHLANAPTIADVVMWLYKKRGIWISLFIMEKWDKGSVDPVQYFDYSVKQKVLYGLKDIPKRLMEFNSPTEAYQEAINYCLINLVKP